MIDGRFVTLCDNNDSKSPIIVRFGYDFLEYANESGKTEEKKRTKS